MTMSIKYDIHAISNASGSGETRKFVQPMLRDALTRRELEERVSHTCTLTPGDMEAVFCAIGQLMLTELSEGRRFHLPGVGYFAPQVGLHLPDDAAEVRTRHVRLDYVNFRPEAEMLRELRMRTRFERLKGTTRSRVCDEAEVVAWVSDYLARHRFLGRREMETGLALRPTMARQWLQRLVDLGVLVREGARNAPVYCLRQ